MHSLLASVTAMCGKSNHFSLSASFQKSFYSRGIQYSDIVTNHNLLCPS